MEVRPIRVVQYGLGMSGRNIARLVHETDGLLLTGGIDQAPELVGQDMGKVLELDQPLDMVVSSDPVAVLAAAYPDIVVVATTSRLNDTYSSIATCLRSRVNVVSTCEELVYPYVRHPELSQNLNQLARRGGVSVVGVGINPGFIQDLLPLVLSGPCTTVKRILSTRVIDATLRRATLYQRIGAGMTREDFNRYKESGQMPHVGLRESLNMIAYRIGWQLDRIDEWVEPIVANDWVYDERVRIAPGQVLGNRQTAVGFLADQDVIVLNWQAQVGAETYDAITIEGTPPIHLRIEGGIHGGQAAPAFVAHAIPATVAAEPGLHTVMDLPPIHYRRPVPAETE